MGSMSERQYDFLIRYPAAVLLAAGLGVIVWAVSLLWKT